MTTELLSDNQQPFEMVFGAESSDVLEWRKKVTALERELFNQETIDLPVRHLFAGGMYARELFIPKGTVLVGRVHKFDHFDIMLSGDVTVSMEDGSVRRWRGVQFRVGRVGKKRAYYAHEDARLVTIHSSEERDPEELFDLMTCSSYEELDEFSVMLDQADYELMTGKVVAPGKPQLNAITNDIELPFDNVCVRPSKIHGLGLFSTDRHKVGQEICFIKTGNHDSILKHINHSLRPNACLVNNGDLIALNALSEIRADEEITVNYRFAGGNICHGR